jgi:hypothetical protein
MKLILLIAGAVGLALEKRSNFALLTSLDCSPEPPPLTRIDTQWLPASLQLADCVSGDRRGLFQLGECCCEEGWSGARCDVRDACGPIERHVWLAIAVAKLALAVFMVRVSMHVMSNAGRGFRTWEVPRALLECDADALVFRWPSVAPPGGWLRVPLADIRAQRVTFGSAPAPAAMPAALSPLPAPSGGTVRLASLTDNQ